LVSLFETILLGNPWSLTISLKNKFATCVASLVFWHGIKCFIFENLSTTTNMESNHLCVLGNPNTKSMFIASQGLFGIGNG
jgi:hypothetical protein